MSELVIEGLRGSVGGREILHGIDLTVRSGEVHAVMGPNGSGKSTLSHVLAGKPGYEVTDGRVTLDGADLLAMEPYERAQAGLLLVLQYPIEVPGVLLRDVMSASLAAGGRSTADLDSALAAESARIGLDTKLLDRGFNVDLSGGERKRNETLQMAVLRPRIAVLDEVDSGLDIDALRAVARRIEAATTEWDLGVLAITHYSCSTSSTPTGSTSSSAGASSRAAGPNWPSSSSPRATSPSASTRSRSSRPPGRPARAIPSPTRSADRANGFGGSLSRCGSSRST
jgi:Fe-S cluster assembly ATP-binding protein